MVKFYVTRLSQNTPQLDKTQAPEGFDKFSLMSIVNCRVVTLEIRI